MKTALLILLLPSIAFAQLALSEIMANEPGDTVALEWIEAFNYGITPIQLSAYRLSVSGDWLTLPSVNINPGSYVIFARYLVADSGQPSFESRWGDGSGYWGDDTSESYVAIDLNFTLANDMGSVALMHIGDSFQDYYDWSEAAPDGISIERGGLDPPGDDWYPCTDPYGSTPGRANSPMRPPDDMTVDFDITPRIIETLYFTQQFIVSISAPVGCHGLIEVFDDTGRRFVTLLDSPVGDRVTFLWNGWDRDGNRTPPGVYIIRAEISGPINVTKTIPVVIAP